MLGFCLLLVHSHSCDVVRARATCRIGIHSVPWSPASVDGLPVVRMTDVHGLFVGVVLQQR